MMTRWRIQLFGGLQATSNDQVVERFRTKKAGIFLAFLAYHDRAHPREVLTELLWPEDDPVAGRTRLRLALASLRRQLEPPGVEAGAVLQASRDAICLNSSAVTTDVAEFQAALKAAERSRCAAERAQHWREAVERYRGELLPGFYDDWILPERQHCAEQFHRALIQLLRYHEQVNDLEGAIEWARQAVTADPLRGEAQHELIRLLMTAGRRDAALRQYREMERLFERDLGAEAPLVLQSLARELGRKGGQSLSPPGERRPLSPSRARPALLSPPLLPPARPDGPAADLPAALPTGTVTLLLIEIAAPVPAVAIDDAYLLLRPLLRGHGGSEVATTDATVSTVFGRVSDALAAAVAGQRALAAWARQAVSDDNRGVADVLPRVANGGSGDDSVLLVRMALHTGEVAPGEAVPQSTPFQHAVRLLIAAHPGQILLSQESAALCADRETGARLVELGSYCLGDARPSERLFQVSDAEREAPRFPPPRAAPAHAGNFPLPVTRFFGREQELPRLCALILDESTRLVTFTGLGGSGKTRLALEATRRLAEPFAHAVYFVPLADLQGTGLIAGALRDSLHLATTPLTEPLEQIVMMLAGQPVLLVLDNCEHLLAESVSIVRTLLERLPLLTCVVTSRQLLGLAGEQEFTVLPLRTPRREDHPEQLFECESVQLFIDRAQGVRPDFQLTPRIAPAVAELCRRLEGIPLALELAAARVRMLTVAQMVAQLDHRFELLVSRRRDPSTRHQSLRAALDWSYELLSPELQLYFARLSLFRGGWTAAAAESVCLTEFEPSPVSSPSAITLAFLEELRDCSLILVEEGEDDIRFYMLETLREYGAEQLDRDDRAATARRHAVFYRDLAEQAEPDLQGPDQTRWFARLTTEAENLREALAWAAESGEPELGLRLGAALLRFWDARAFHAEVRTCLAALLDQSAGVPHIGLAIARAKATYVAGQLAALQHDYAVAVALLRASLSLYRELEERRGIATVLLSLGSVVRVMGQPGAARSMAEEGLSLWKQLGDRWGIGQALGLTAELADAQCDYATARARFEDSLALSQEAGDRQGIAWALNSLGQIAQRQVELEAARVFHEESQTIWQSLGNRGGIAWSVMNLGHIARAWGDLDTAHSLYERWVLLAHELVQGPLDPHVGFSLARLALDRREAGKARALLQECHVAFQQSGEQNGIALCYLYLGRVAQLEGDLDSARARYSLALPMFMEMNDRWAVALSLDAWADLAAARGAPLRAARLLGAANRLREQLGTPRPPIEQGEYDGKVAALRAALGVGVFAVTQAEGAALTLEQAISEALS